MKKDKREEKKATTKRVSQKDLAKVSGGALYADSNKGNSVIK